MVCCTHKLVICSQLSAFPCLDPKRPPVIVIFKNPCDDYLKLFETNRKSFRRKNITILIVKWFIQNLFFSDCLKPFILLFIIRISNEPVKVFRLAPKKTVRLPCP